MWLSFAIVAPFFWAMVHVLDEHCVDHILEKPWMGVVTSSIATALLYLLIPFVFPFVDWKPFVLQWFIAAFMVGVLIQISQAFYFYALSYSEAGIVAAYWNLIPAILPLSSYLFFHELFGLNKYLGIAILIIASSWICVLDANFRMRINTLVLMLLASIFQVIAYMLISIVYDNTHFFFAFLGIISGIVFCGMLPIALIKTRMALLKNNVSLIHKIPFFILIEVCNLLALGSAQMAIKLGNASLVSAVETTAPGFTFVISLILLKKMNILKEVLLNNLGEKIAAIALMVIGVWLVS